MLMAANEPDRIYSVVGRFNKSRWRSFARTKLGLTDIQIEECEENYPNDMKEQRYQMIRTWQSSDRQRNTIVRLEQLAENPADVSTESQEQSSGVKCGEQPRAVASSSSSVSTPVGDVTVLPAQSLSNSGSCESRLPDSRQHESSADPRRRESDLEDSGRGGATSLPVAELGNASGRAYSNEKDPESKDTASTVLANLPTASLHSSSQVVGEDGVVEKLKKILRSKKKPIEVQDSTDSGQLPGHNYCQEVTEVIVKNTSAAQWEEIKNKGLRLYNISSPKGCALILNNSFKSDRDERNFRLGSEVDTENMAKLWVKMGCKLHRGEPQCEKKAWEMKGLLQEMTELKDKYSFIVIVIMTHGGKEDGEVVFKGIDHKSIKMEEMKEMFNNINAKELCNVPKFFILQFCRGEELDKGVSTDGIEEAMKRMVQPNITACSDVAVDSSGRLPAASDMLFAYATHENYKALRNVRHGSWFINAITNVFMKYSHIHDVEGMLTEVHNAMKSMSDWFEEQISEDEKRRYFVKAMSTHSTSFTKKLFLRPGYK